MMRKTYKSKRDTAGGLDLRDDFDALYIKNIKQTKRELSSIGSSDHHGVASNRVRKRKYVKRIVKEIEVAPRESTSTSVFLTPDKSIRVNKALDPFDLLLNSSPVWPEAKQTVREDPFDRLLREEETKAKPKAYARKKTRPVKRINYMSSSDTDKENSQTCDSATGNTTDIKAHELYIEKEPTPCPNIDESIHNLLNNLRRKSSIGSVQKSYKNRLTKTLYSPVRTSQMSPLSSTPMNNKQRSKSIYKFSPISISKFDDSPGNIINIINEENEEPVEQNKSIVFVPKNLSNPLKNSNKSQSLLAHRENNSETQKSSKPLFSSDEMESLHQNVERSQNLLTETEEKNSINGYKQILNKTHDNTTSVRTTEMEPFIGFNNDINYSIASSSVINQNIKCDGQKSIDTSAATLEKSKDLNVEQTNEEKDEAKEMANNSVSQSAEKEFGCDLNSSNTSKSFDQLLEVTKLTEPSEPFLGFEANDDSKSIYNDTINDCSVNSEPNSLNKVDSMCSHKLTSNTSSLNENSTDKSGYSEEDLDKSGCSKEDLDKSEEKESFVSQDIDRESLYDTCNSEQSSTAPSENGSKEHLSESSYSDKENSDNEEDLKESIEVSTCNSEQSSIADESNEIINELQVALERLNDSVFQKYYDEIAHYYSENESKEHSNESGLSDKENSENGEGLKESIEESTCNSEQSSIADESNEIINEPQVALERLNESVFQKYYDEMAHNYSQEESKEHSNKSCLSDKENSANGEDLGENIEESINNSEDKKNCVEEALDSFANAEVSGSSHNGLEKLNKTEVDNSTIYGDDSLYEDDNIKEPLQNDTSTVYYERCFVTTRRRKNVVQSPSFMVLEDSNASLSSSNCDKTMLSNNCINILEAPYNVLEQDSGISSINPKERSFENREDSIAEEGDHKSLNKDSNDTQNLFDSDARISFITTRKSSKLPRISENPIKDQFELQTEFKDLNSVNKDSNDTQNLSDPDARISFITTRKSSKLPRISENPKKDRFELETEIKDLNSVNKDSNDTPNLSDSDARISFINMRKSSKLPRISENLKKDQLELETEMKPAIVLQPGKKWERSLSIYRRMTMADNFDQSILEEEDLHMKGRKYRESVISMMEMQDCKGTLQNESVQSRRSTITCKPSRSTIRIVKDSSSSIISLSSTSTDFEEFKGFLEDCDDTIIELSKLSIDENEVTIVEKFNEQSRVVATSREYVLRRCNQTEPILFDECYPDTLLKNCRKIGEGVYGEVYLWRAPDGRARVMKVVPIAGSVRVNGECQKDYHEIISEIVIAMELSALRAPIAEIECHFDEGKDVDQLDLHAVENATDVFNEVLAVRCVFGNYPNRLLDLWDLYDECKGSENDNPAVLPADQQYIVLELANAGEDLESFQFGTAEQAYALLLQVAFGLAVGEESFQFEHRDLHWGNVLIAPTEQKYATFILRGRSHRVLRRGVAATIIDYSLSRVSLPVGGAPCALYNDLGQDESLFGAVGDYQFEVYRLMRQKLGNDWKNFEPYTNVLWLHYLVDKMITSLRYKRPSTKLHKQYISKLKAVKERLLSYRSAVQFVLTDQEF